jgi:hypothetical protein
MQDLGKITIDINEGGGSSAGGAAAGGASSGSGAVKSILGQGMNKALDAAGKSIDGAANMASTALAGIGVAIGVASAAFGVLVSGVKAVADALLSLHKFIMEMAGEIREYSPGIQMAEMGNEITMMMTKFRLGSQYGASIGSQIKEAGRVDRATLEIKTVLASMGSVFLRPITKLLGDILESIVRSLPKIINVMAAFANYMAEASKYATYAGASREAARKFVPAGGLDLFDWANPESPIVKMWKDIATELRAINRKTPDSNNYKALNAPFLADLALMGAKI